MGIDAGSIYSEVRIKLDALNADIISAETAFDKLGSELKANATTYSDKIGKAYAASLKIIAAEMKNVSAAAKNGALTDAESTARLLDLRKQELQVLQKRAIMEQGGNKATVSAINESQKAIAALTEKQRLLTGETQKTTTAFGGLSNILGIIGGALSIRAITSMMKDAVSEFSQAEAAAQRLDKALELRGMQSSAIPLKALADSMQRLGVAGADVVIQLQAQLVAEGRSEKQIKDLINASAGLSAVTGDDLSVSLEQLDKTFEGLMPRTASLKAAMGDLTEEQLRGGAGVDAILTKYGDFAGKVAETDNALRRAKEEFGDASESIGQAFKPALLGVLDVLSVFVRAFTAAPDSIKIVGVVIAGVAAAATAAIPILGMFGVTAAAALGPVGIAAAAIAGLGAAVAIAARNADEAKHPMEYYNKRLESMALSAASASQEIDSNRKASEKLIETAEKNNASGKLTQEQATKLIALYPELAGKVDVYRASIEEVNKKLKEQQAIEAKQALMPLIKEYGKQDEAVRKAAETVSSYKYTYSEMVRDIDKKSKEHRTVTNGDTQALERYRLGVESASTALTLAKGKQGAALGELTAAARGMGLTYDVATQQLVALPPALESAGTATAKLTAIEKGYAAAIALSIRNQASFGDAESGLQERINLTKELIKSLNETKAPTDAAQKALAGYTYQLASLQNITKLDAIKKAISEIGLTTDELKEKQRAQQIADIENTGKAGDGHEAIVSALKEQWAAEDALAQTNASKKLAESAQEYRDKLDALNGVVKDTLGLERERLIVAAKKSGADPKAIEEYIAVINELYDALGESKNVDEFKKKLEKIGETASTIAGTLNDFVSAIGDLVAQQYDNEIDAAQSAADEKLRILQEEFDAEQELRQEALAQEKVLQEAYKELGDSELEEKYKSLAAKEEAAQNYQSLSLDQIAELLAAAKAAGNEEMQSALLVARERVVADKQASDEILSTKKAYEAEAARLEYEAAMASWRVNLATAIANAALATIKAISSMPEPISMAIAGVAIGALGGIQVAAVGAAMPRPPKLATGGIVLPASGGVATIQAENGYPEMDLNGGPSGRPFMREFARAIASEMGGARGGNIQIIVQSILDGKVVAENTVSYINNGQVVLR